VGSVAVAAIRPEDLIPGGIEAGAGNGIDVTATSVEYCGREYIVEGRTASGEAVHFRSLVRIAPGEGLRLAVAPERVRVFALPGAAPARVLRVAEVVRA
jgi:hypothetical protein